MRYKCKECGQMFNRLTKEGFCGIVCAYAVESRKIKDLERQLAEARELVFTAYQEGWNDNRNNLGCWETHWIDSDSKYNLEQLKEKGDDL